MPDTTPNLALPLLAAAQAQKHVTHNEALVRLDAVVQLAVIDRRAAPPSSPAEGDRHLVDAGASGAFTGHEDEIALRDGEGWSFLAPRAGWRLYIAAERASLIHDGDAWTDALAATPGGGAFALRAYEAEVTLAGASTVAALAIPDRAICLGVASRTAEAVTGATSYSVGIAGDTAKFGSSLGVAPGASNIGVIGPQAFYADTPLVITAAGGAFTGGKVRLVLYCIVLAAPL
ncbi:DUF2793 domain-containing protein [Bosea sp. 117]|uniref:DUF2793 domain-containing protein n=1 Tax=Bosea sp. 117 TaxID=1125973 RepID=UPI00049450B6|nr:DUF2793 domain-containing protein [Bosea sp. 117]